MASIDPTELMEVAVLRRWSGYYQRCWSRYKSKERFFLAWNWAAFFFGVWWLLYRRMYWFVLLDLMIVYFAARNSSASFSTALVLGRIVLGLFGTRIYFWYVCQTIIKLERAMASMDVAREVIRSKYQTLADWPM